MQHIDYNAIIKNFENYRLPKKCSTRKKFEQQYGGKREVYEYEVIRFRRLQHYSPTPVRKYVNHLKAQDKTKTHTQSKKVIQKYNSLSYYQYKKSKGMFNCLIRMSKNNIMINIKRRQIEIITTSGKINLNDKSERFTASIEYDFNFDFLLKVQQILKQKPSGSYILYI